MADFDFSNFGKEGSDTPTQKKRYGAEFSWGSGGLNELDNAPVVVKSNRKIKWLLIGFVVLFGLLSLIFGVRYLLSPNAPKLEGSRTQAVLAYLSDIQEKNQGSYQLQQEYKLSNGNTYRDNYIKFMTTNGVKINLVEKTYKAILGDASLTQLESIQGNEVSLLVPDYTLLSELLVNGFRGDILDQFQKFSKDMQPNNVKFRETLTDFYAKYMSEFLSKKHVVSKALTKEDFISNLLKLKTDDEVKKVATTYVENPLGLYTNKDGVLTNWHKEATVNFKFVENKGVYTVSDDTDLSRYVFGNDELEKVFSDIIYKNYGVNVTPEFSKWVDAVTKEVNRIRSTKSQKADESLLTLFDDVPIKYNLEKGKGVDLATQGILPNAFGYADYISYYGEGNLPIGTGAMNNPLGLNTSATTWAYSLDNKLRSTVNISVKKVLRGQEAIDYLVMKDDRNKGLTVNDKELAIFLIDVTNGSNKEVTIKPEISLSDRNRTLINRTGKMYGLVESATLKAGETKEFQDWVLATELDKRYVLWGKSFTRDIEPVWLRIFKGSE